MESLPYEIVCMIQDYLPFKDFMACQIANKVFHSYSENDEAKIKRLGYIQLKIDNYPVTSDEKIASIIEEAEHINIGNKFKKNSMTLTGLRRAREILEIRGRFISRIAFTLDERINILREQIKFRKFAIKNRSLLLRNDRFRFEYINSNDLQKEAMQKLFGLRTQIKKNIHTKRKKDSRDALKIPQTLASQDVRRYLNLKLATIDHNVTDQFRISFIGIKNDLARGIRDNNMHFVSSIYGIVSQLNDLWDIHNTYYQNSILGIEKHCLVYEDKAKN
jgi:hypothetical protein